MTVLLALLRIMKIRATSTWEKERDERAADSALSASAGSANCAFQYYAEGKMQEDTGLITRQEADALLRKMQEDTGLITRQEADALWKKYEKHFIEQVERQDSA